MAAMKRTDVLLAQLLPHAVVSRGQAAGAVDRHDVNKSQKESSSQQEGLAQVGKRVGIRFAFQDSEN